MESAIRRTGDIYGPETWGSGYVRIGRNGRLRVHPEAGDRGADLWDVWTSARDRGMGLPLLVRFPQILTTQVGRLHGAFKAARSNFNYAPPYRPVFPLKVNHRPAVVEEILRAGREIDMGVEVGSKVELLIALGLDIGRDGLVVCNGFKDRSYVRLAALAARSGRNVILVLERLQELSILEGMGTERGGLWIGLRGKLFSRGSGKWSSTGGETGKFGLDAGSLLHCLDRLRMMGMGDRVAMLHFHLGSQIPEIRRIKAAVREATRVYAKVRKMGFDVAWLNVGGGLGVDYDGSGSSGDSSVNYTMEEYANDVVFNAREVCDAEDVPPPGLVSESGRALTAHHAFLLTNVEERETPPPPAEGTGAQEHPLMVQLEETARVIGAKNFREYYHDALLEREELQSLFELGYLSLEARARAEAVFRDVCMKALRFSRTAPGSADEFVSLQKAFRRGYVGNFSVFRSIPDAWSVGQLFPVVPIHRLNEAPTEIGFLQDLTCDSDGKVETFVDSKTTKSGLELHPTAPGEPYVLAVCFVGAYQDVMGNSHNLLGRPDDVTVRVGDSDDPELVELTPGDRADQLARAAGWDPAAVRRAFAALWRGPGRPPTEDLEDFWSGTPYLDL